MVKFVRDPGQTCCAALARIGRFDDRIVRVFLAGLLLAQGLLVAWIGYRNSPGLDEPGHLASGLYIWHFGRFDAYRVNPPLTRALAAAPVAFARPRMDWDAHDAGRASRPEWKLGRDLVRLNPRSWFWYFTIARWTVVPLSVLGAYITYRWSRELYGVGAGLIAVILYVFSPNMLAWSATVCPDAPAASAGVCAGYFFWRWLKHPTAPRACAAGMGLGFALLTKSTWIILLALWPAVWVAWFLRGHRRPGQQEGDQRCSDTLPPTSRGIFITLALGIYVLNLGYGFERSFLPLGSYTFYSRALAGSDSLVEGASGGNRFSNSWMAMIPVPLPENYLTGIDLQKLDFEIKKPSFLRGEWKRGGWWYYYVYAAGIKVPLGTWLLAASALAWRTRKRAMSSRANGALDEDAREPRQRVHNEIVLLAPALLVFALVSTQTGINRHFRYVLPSLPFLFIWISAIGEALSLSQRRLFTAVSVLGLMWSVGSSLSCYPHSMSYFNELVGGPAGGHYHLLDSNIDWGQDMWYLRGWLDEHPQVHRVAMAYTGFDHPRYFEIEYYPVPDGPWAGIRYAEERAIRALGPQPGWHAMSVEQIHNPSHNYRYFLRFRTIGRAGYSIYIYHIGIDEANRVRRELGLPELPSDPKAQTEGSAR